MSLRLAQAKLNETPSQEAKPTNPENINKRAGEWLKRYSACLAFSRPWV
jgi:hypothetical protein